MFLSTATFLVRMKRRAYQALPTSNEMDPGSATEEDLPRRRVRPTRCATNRTSRALIFLATGLQSFGTVSSEILRPARGQRSGGVSLLARDSRASLTPLRATAGTEHAGLMSPH
jgi:hypothetical protein